MYLKRLELRGFKSFPSKTDIIFKEGVTAIVGPNGSGKSNISDAVRWVLGEQSIKSLRGDKLEDVIFAGTDSKKPMNFCEVALTIDNSSNQLDIEFSEVTIKRRAYRNGESEFFLNNKSCRLKDIKEILLDTGIGKDGYSIIEQGKVDEILSNNPQNRRKVFDEACGISKFRYKKQEAERNLRNTKENLDRIDDIYVEIENQLKPLYNQQKKATKYIELRSKLKEIEVNNYIKLVENVDVDLTEVNKHIELIGKQFKEIEENKLTVEEEHNKLNTEIENMDSNINKSVEYINSIKTVISQKDSQINLLNERIKNYKNDIERKYSELSEIRDTLSQDNLSLKSLDTDVEEKSTLIEKLSIEVEDISKRNKEKKDKVESLSSEIENLKDDTIELLNKKQEYSNKISTLEANKSNISLRTETIADDIKELNTKLIGHNDRLESEEKKLSENNNRLSNLKESYINCNKELNSLATKNKEIEVQIQNNKYKINDFNSKLNVYIDMENHYEGFNKGVKEVLKNKNLRGIYGALGQVISVPQKYEKSIEAALGAYMQNIITQDEYSAKEAINYLKKNNLGRVTFLPMNVIKSNKIDKNYMKNKTNYIGIASELITYEEKYKNIIENILGRTIIIENIDEGIKFAKETGHKYKVVTLEGEILNPGGSLTGGSIRVSGNILSRKRLIGEYKENIETLNKENSNLIENKNKVEENIKTKNSVLIKTNEDILQSEKDILILKNDTKRIKEDIENLNQSVEKLENEKSNLSSNLQYTNEKIDSTKLLMDELENKNNNNKKKIEELSINSKQNIEEYEGWKVKFDELNINLAKNKEIYEGLLRDIERLKSQKSNLNNKSNELDTSIQSQETEIEDLEKNITIEETEKENLNKQLVDNNNNLENKKVTKDSLKNKLEEVLKSLKLIDRQFIDLKESSFKLESKKERLKSSQEMYINKLFEDYEMTLLDALELKDESVVIDKKLMESLRREIRSLGNVNIDSIKEYEEIKERYDFYSEQKGDLEESIKAIENIISDLEANMKIEFEEKFNQINENYKYVYKRLFGGGFGELTILDKENVLESDIEITAQPPGKKMKNLSLLSGGEKALTAISILFSILLAKPTPFCILDEIEAPLDDANIFRFGEFLKELSKETQFISVTHRRGTMEAADYIYGVTMQEKAISKVISLQLNEAEQMTDLV